MKQLWWRGWMTGVLAGLLWSGAVEAEGAKKWREYTGCTIREHKGNDGDSFHVEVGSLKSATARHKLIRLYFVDTPESEESLPERLEEQRAYWELPNAATVVRCGKAAMKFTEQFLKDGFVVHSRLSDALGRSKIDRDYGMVEAHGEDLGYALVRNGLARVFGSGTDVSELESYKRDEEAWWRRLRQAETDAKRERKGCWAYSQAATGRPGFANRLPLPAPAPATPTAPPPAVTPRQAPPMAPVPASRPAAIPATLPSAPPPADGSLAAATQSRLSALTAPRDVPEQEIVLTRTIYIYSLESPITSRILGQLKAGATLRVLRGISPERAHVSFSTSSGKTYEGAARFVDLGL